TAKVGPVMLAFLVLFARDVGYVYRIRTITSEKLSWKSSIYVIILWEFASAVTPSVVGGTAVAVFILMKEGLKLGKALAYTMVTAIFDNLYFVLVAPFIFLIASGEIFPQNSAIESQIGKSLPTLFFISYGLIASYTLIMAFAVLVNPRWFKWILLRITSIKWLRKWRPYAYEQGAEIMMASKELRGKKYSYWIKIALSTLFIWTARYAMLNCV
ncbi:TIGR00374 family protein, partial [Marivirga lumbricoides]